MRTRSYTVKHEVYASEIVSAISTEDPQLADAIAWADGHPVVWRIVTGTRSKAFGRKSCFYIGWAQSNNAAEAILERVRAFHDEVTARDYRATQIWRWRARFTLEHYGKRGFKGGFFQHHDGSYDRLCMTLDFTPETLPEVLRRFVSWACPEAKDGVIKVDGKIAAELPLLEDGRR